MAKEKSSRTQRILVVDDIPQNISVLNELLKEEYSISAATSGDRALKITKSDNPPDLVLLDVMMPGMDGYEVCRRLKSDQATKDIPIIFVTARGDVEDEAKGLELGAVDYLTKPANPSIVLARVKTHLELRAAREVLKRQNQILEEKVRERTKELALTRDVTIQSLASLAETRDNETGGHIRRTQTYVKVLAEELCRKNAEFATQLDADTIEVLYKSVPLHDIGKVGVPDRILLKPGKLTPEEFDEMKKHTIYGRDAILTAEKQLGSNSFLTWAKEIAYNPHEKWDGSGYPEGKQGHAIPLSGRFMALVDVYDALISKRVYKPPMPHSKAVAIIEEGRGLHFDSDLVDCFLAKQQAFKDIALQQADGEEERAALS